MTTITLTLPKLYPLQEEILQHEARYKVVNIGRRSGKTVMGKDALINGGLSVPAPYAYFAPTYKMLRPVWDELKALAYPITKHVNENEKRLALLTGATIDAWSLDAPDGARGRKYAGVVIDEAAMIAKLKYAWEEVIRPTLTDLQGWAMFLSTPKGKNFFWQLYQRGIDPLFPDWQSWQAPTSVNPHIKPNEIDAARQELPSRSFAQEYLAEFLEDSGAVFRGVAGIATLQPQEPQRNHEYVIGVDWARSHDFTVLAVIDSTTNELVYLDRFNQIDWTLQRGRLAALAERYNPRLILAESNSIGEPNIEELVKQGLPVEGFTTTASTKPQLIDKLALAIEQQSIQLLQDDVLIHELQSYTMQRTPSGNYKYSAPEGGHDDTVMALALAWRGASMPKPVYRVSTKGGI